MSDRNMRNPRPGVGAAESRPDLKKDILPGGGSDDLDNLLASLADDVPDMPADFHARWTSAVAEEAGSGAQGGTPAGSRPEKIHLAAPRDASADSRTGETRPAGKIRRLPAAWSRLIGVAAVMVFLVGGTLLTRDSFHAKMSQPVMASDAGGAVLQSARVEESAANLTEADSDGAEFITTDAEQPAMMLGAEPADEAAYDEAELDSALSGTAETTAEEPAMMLSMAPADEATVDETVDEEVVIEEAYRGTQATVQPALDSALSGTVGAAPPDEAVFDDGTFKVAEEDAEAELSADEAAYNEADFAETEEAAAEDVEEAAVSGSMADADAGAPAAGLMMSSVQADASTAMPTAIPEAAAEPEAEALSEEAVLTETDANRTAYRGDSLSGTAEAVTEESLDAAIGQEQAEQPAAASETARTEGTVCPVREPYREDCPPGTAASETAHENEPEQIEPDRHPVLTFLRDMGFFIRWIAPWALVLAVGVFAGWLVGRRR